MSNVTAHWLKRLSESDKPVYQTIPDLIEEDVASGRLRPRDRLPALRDLSEALRINYTTLARGYAEARKRGLIDSRAGSGSYVRGRPPALPLSAGTALEMTMNMPPEPPEMTELLAQSAGRIIGTADAWSLLRYQDFGGSQFERGVASQWLRHTVPSHRADAVLVCPGIHNALVALLLRLVKPGTVICVDCLAYPGLKVIANQLGMPLAPLPRDDEGLDANAFEALCRTRKPGVLYCNPTLQNPTTRTLSQNRREHIADIALRYDVPIIEDDAYGMLCETPPVALATLAPELTYYVTGMSKCFGAGLRVAYVVAPSARHAERLSGSLRATTVMASPYMSYLAARWIESGFAQQMLEAIRAECAVRQHIAAQVFAGREIEASQDCFHLWLTVPTETGWSASELASHLRTKQIGVVSGAAFSTDGNPPNAVRICLGGPGDVLAMEDSLHLVADMLDHPDHLHSPML
ncbi:DNA-binding transcriptional MocR family regulator [Paraburkholderia bannensis]|uniref:DNA-binding transcriptional MocR family regulator n=1 Tax=Paraburkholderia bannensis TaxID=765414 RepID=A0A7W9TZA3_9BURK|nr:MULTISPECIES: PLP-dependent aminotransferase family protein [Paraburkholderia]MBB3259093.1 DNA-binding transcriptional MocR family regulator [Paraburkholderia sp. WP4_3_2]MBB6104108.1 DNA-binding transcriptional MocR family regulator [Paraburkholderia bannensis]